MGSADRPFTIVALCVSTLVGSLVGHPTSAEEPAPSGRLVFETEWGAPGSDPGQLDHPMGIAVGPGDRVYVADGGNERIQVFSPDGDLLAVWNLPAGSRPTGLLARADGSLLVADYTGDRILVLDSAGTVQAEWGGSGTDPGQLTAPSGLAQGDDGSVLVVEFMGQRVQELDASGHFVRFVDGGDEAMAHVAQRQSGMGSMDHGSMAPPGPMGAAAGGNPHGLFSFPSDAAVSPGGAVYVSNAHAYEILVFDRDGSLSAGWGTKGSDPGQWEVPVGLALDADGNLYVADSANFRVQVLDPQGRPLLASRADERWYRADGKKLYSPTDLAIDSRGRLYVVNFAASRIERFRVELPPAP